MPFQAGIARLPLVTDCEEALLVVLREGAQVEEGAAADGQVEAVAARAVARVRACRHRPAIRRRRPRPKPPPRRPRRPVPARRRPPAAAPRSTIAASAGHAAARRSRPSCPRARCASSGSPASAPYTVAAPLVTVTYWRPSFSQAIGRPEMPLPVWKPHSSLPLLRVDREEAAGLRAGEHQPGGGGQHAAPVGRLVARFPDLLASHRVPGQQRAAHAVGRRSRSRPAPGPSHQFGPPGFFCSTYLTFMPRSTVFMNTSLRACGS